MSDESIYAWDAAKKEFLSLYAANFDGYEEFVFRYKGTPYHLSRFKYECFKKVSLEGSWLQVDHYPDLNRSNNREENLRAADSVMQSLNKTMHLDPDRENGTIVGVNIILKRHAFVVSTVTSSIMQ